MSSPEAAATRSVRSSMSSDSTVTSADAGSSFASDSLSRRSPPASGSSSMPAVPSSPFDSSAFSASVASRSLMPTDGSYAGKRIQESGGSASPDVICPVGFLPLAVHIGWTTRCTTNDEIIIVAEGQQKPL